MAAEQENVKVLYEWEANEFSLRSSLSVWVWVVLVIAAAWAVWAHQWIALATLVMIGVVVILSKRMQPRMFTHQITEAGVAVGNKLHAYSDLKSFWIVLDGKDRVLNLLPNKKVGLVLTLQLGDANVDKVREALVKFLPEDASRGEDAVDKIGRFFRL